MISTANNVRGTNTKWPLHVTTGYSFRSCTSARNCNLQLHDVAVVIFILSAFAPSEAASGHWRSRLVLTDDHNCCTACGPTERRMSRPASMHTDAQGDVWLLSTKHQAERLMTAD
eukprot:733064-Pleurochrysis_carterae.AAC.2